MGTRGKCTVKTIDLLVFLFWGLLFLVNVVLRVKNTTLITCECCLFFLYIFWKIPVFFLRYLMIFFAVIGNIAGVIIIETTGIYLHELQVNGFNAGSLALLSFVQFSFIFFLWIYDHLKILSQNDNKISLANISILGRHITLGQIFIWIVAISLMLMLLQSFSHPFFFTHIDRFQYRDLYIQGPWKLFLYIITNGIPFIFAIILQYKFANNNEWVSKKQIASLLLILFLIAVLFFMIGEKFGGFWGIIVVACSIYSAYSEKFSLKRIHKQLRNLLVVFLVILGLLFLHRSLNYSANSFAGFQGYVIQRIAQQGQLWWKIYDQEQNKSTHANELNDEIKTYFQFGKANFNEYNHGIYKIMRMTTPGDVFEHKIASGSRYALSTLATIYYYFKEAGLLIYVMLAPFIIVIFMHCFVYAAKNCYVIELFLANKILFILYQVITQSDFDVLFSYKILLQIVVLTLLIKLRETVCLDFKGKVKEKHIV